MRILEAPPSSPPLPDALPGARRGPLIEKGRHRPALEARRTVLGPATTGSTVNVANARTPDRAQTCATSRPPQQRREQRPGPNPRCRQNWPSSSRPGQRSRPPSAPASRRWSRLPPPSDGPAGSLPRDHQHQRPQSATFARVGQRRTLGGVPTLAESGHDHRGTPRGWSRRYLASHRRQPCPREQPRLATELVCAVRGNASACIRRELLISQSMGRASRAHWQHRARAS